MTKIVIVNKNGDVETVDCKAFSEQELFKKCGFRKCEGFEKRHTWSVKVKSEKHNVSLFARDSGKHNNVNKFEFPPPMDNELYYGNCALVDRDDQGNVLDLDDDSWAVIYEKLFGGFETLKDSAEDDELENDELDDVPAEYKTKCGYLKDGFVVDSDEYENSPEKSDADNNDELVDEDEDEDEDEDVEYPDDNDGSELCAEDYLESSDES